MSTSTNGHPRVPEPHPESGICIVGGGMTAISAARRLREMGFTGEVTVFAGEAAEPYERPALSKEFLTDERSGAPSLYDPDEMCAAGIRLELETPVASIDPVARTLTTGDGRMVGYSRLLLATGSRCRRLDLPGSELAGVSYLRELHDAQRLRPLLQHGRRVAIVGGGVIGLEVAASAIHRGCEVTVVEAGPHLMGRVVPPELAETVADLHRARGVDIVTGVRPDAFLGEGGRVCGVALSDGRVVPADVVVVGIGVVPRVELAEEAGITVADGIVVDEYFRTSDPHVFAAGDVARVFHAGQRRHLRTESWRSAESQGQAAAACMLGRDEPHRAIPWMWSDQHDAHIQTVGFGFADAQLVRRGAVAERSGLTYFAVQGNELVGAFGISLGAGVGKTIRVAQLLMERGQRVDADRLRDPTVNIKSLLTPNGVPGAAAAHPPTHPRPTAASAAVQP